MLTLVRLPFEKMKWLPLLLFFISSSLAVRACDCLRSPVKEQIKATPYLLTGEVVEILDATNPDGRAFRQFLREIHQDSSHGYSVRIRVLESFKGEFKVGEVIELKSDYSSCAMTFGLGERWVLFLHKQDNALFSTHCSYSDRLNGSKHATDLMQTIYAETRRKRRG